MGTKAKKHKSAEEVAADNARRAAYMRDYRARRKSQGTKQGINKMRKS